MVVAATGDDKANLVVSLLAKTEFGVPRIVARVNNPKNEWMFDEAWGVDVAVSTPRLMTALVEEAVSVGDLVRHLHVPAGRGQPGRADPARRQPRSSASGSATSTGPADTVLVAIIREDRADRADAATTRSRPATSCCSSPRRSVEDELEAMLVAPGERQPRGRED